MAKPKTLAEVETRLHLNGDDAYRRGYNEGLAAMRGWAEELAVPSQGEREAGREGDWAAEAAQRIADAGAFRFDLVNQNAYRDADLKTVAAIIRNASPFGLVRERGDGWLPIEGAPKDQTILGGWWHNSQMWRWGRCEYDDGWFCRDGGTPTHYLPLPLPPGQPKEGKEQG